MMEENQGLKNELEEIKKVNDVSLKKVRVYEKMVLDFDVRVSGLEKLGKELMDSPEFSDNQKNHVLGINFLLSFRIFYDQRIAAIKRYRGGSGDELETSIEDVEGCLWCRGLYGAKGKDMATFRTKKWIVVLVINL
nr:hypothetical protein [Tanacetum cinerariifolium]